MKTTLQEAREKINLGEVKAYVDCATSIDVSGKMEIDFVSKDYWVKQAITKHSFCCTPDTKVYIDNI